MKILEFIFEAIGIFSLVTTPFVAVWGWIRWARNGKRWTLLAIFSFLGFALATGSVLLAVTLMIYGHFRGGFGYYDPRLMRIYACGLLLSASGLILAFAGIWRFSTVRWHALFCSFGTLVYWFTLAEAE
jgi:hypothetical protein